jgi:hypothetical protein
MSYKGSLNRARDRDFLSKLTVVSQRVPKSLFFDVFHGASDRASTMFRSMTWVGLLQLWSDQEMPYDS